MAKMRRKPALNLREMVGGSRRGRTFDTFVVWQPPGGTEAKRVCPARHFGGFRVRDHPARANPVTNPTNSSPVGAVLAFPDPRTTRGGSGPANRCEDES